MAITQNALSAALPTGSNSNNWHRLDASSVIHLLGSDGSFGLKQEAAARRLIEHGANELKSAHRISPWSILLAQFKNALIAILLVATALSVFLGDSAEAIAIALIVLFAVLASSF